MTKTLSGTHRVFVLLLVCLILFVGVSAFSASPAHAAAVAKPLPKTHVIARHAQPESRCYLLIIYDYGNSAYCVTKIGYNGINFIARNVVGLGFNTCLDYGWLLEYTGNGKSYVDYTNNGIYSGPSPYYGAITQVDVQAVFC